MSNRKRNDKKWGGGPLSGPVGACGPWAQKQNTTYKRASRKWPVVVVMHGLRSRYMTDREN